MTDSGGLSLPEPITADARVLKLVEHAAKAERYDMLIAMLKEIELLEMDIVRTRKSRSQTAGLKAMALDSKIQEIRVLIAGLIRR